MQWAQAARVSSQWSGARWANVNFWCGPVVHADLFDATLESLQILLSLSTEVIGPTRTESEEPKEVEPMEATAIAYAAPYCTPTKTFPVSICESAAPKIIPCRCS